MVIQINGLGNGSFNFGKSSYWYQHPHHYALSGKMSKAHGAHYFKVGSEYRYHVGDGTYPNLMNFNFYPNTPANSYIRPDIANSGDPWASFLLGALDTTASSTANNVNKVPYQSIRIPFLGLFVHDDWKITPKLTLNIGLRYELETPITERYNRSVKGFAFDQVNPIDAAARANYARNPIPELPVNQFRAMGGLTFVGADGFWQGGHLAGSTDLGDLSHLMPCLHSSSGGVAGRLHGTDFKVVDYKLACLTPARTLAMTAIDLLADGAQGARGVLERSRPELTREKYLALHERLTVERTYDEAALTE